MPDDFLTEYSERTDDELLHLASQRHYLTKEAGAALDTELARRSLTESDRLEHQRFEKRQEARDSRKHRRKPIGPFKYRMSWRDILSAFAIIALISITYLVIPDRYHMKNGWEAAAFSAMAMFVIIAIAGKAVLRQKPEFWIALTISSLIQLIVVHYWTERVGLTRISGRAIAGFDLLLFLALYWLIKFSKRIFDSEEVRDRT